MLGEALFWVALNPSERTVEIVIGSLLLLFFGNARQIMWWLIFRRCAHKLVGFPLWRCNWQITGFGVGEFSCIYAQNLSRLPVYCLLHLFLMDSSLNLLVDVYWPLKKKTLLKISIEIELGGCHEFADLDVNSSKLESIVSHDIKNLQNNNNKKSSEPCPLVLF